MISWKSGLILSIFYAVPALACDTCAPYIADIAKEGDADSFSMGMWEQYTSRRSLSKDNGEIDNPANQFLTGSITQLFAGYQADRLFGQITLPYIYRDYRRIADGAVERGHEEGIGDMLLVLGHTPVMIQKEGTAVRWRVYGGMKLPTGDSNQLRPTTNSHPHGIEPAEDVDSHGDEHDEAGHRGRPLLAHNGVDHGNGGNDQPEIPDGYTGAVHGHDIALGSGSIDFLAGTSMYFRYDRFVNRAFFQYFFRNEGSYDYRYGNDLTWSINPAYAVWSEDAGSIEVGMNFWGDYKDFDVADGNKDTFTCQTNLYLGPQIGWTIGEHWSGVVGLDLPVLTNNTETQTVPDWRGRMGVTYRF